MCLLHSLERPGGWCTHEGAIHKQGDFDGDGFIDLVCHNSHDDEEWTILSATGCFGAHRANKQYVCDRSWGGNLVHWCTHGGAVMNAVTDYDMDGKMDLICHDNAYVELKLTSIEAQ